MIHRLTRPQIRRQRQGDRQLRHTLRSSAIGHPPTVQQSFTLSGGPPVGPGGIFSLGDPTVLEALATSAGFADVAVAEFPTTFKAESIDAHVERVSALAGPFASAFAAASAEQLDAVRQTAAQLAAAYMTNDGVAIPGEALLVTGLT